MRRKPEFTGRPGIVHPARYSDHPIERYNANPLIRAIRPLLNVEAMQAALTRFPKYEASQRNDPREWKVSHLSELFRFYVCFPRVTELHEAIFTLICEGYVARQPYSAEDNARRQMLYEMSDEGMSFGDDDVEANGAEFCAALIGIPGIGKSKALKKVTAPYRRVIYHPDIDVYQIPALLIEMPYKGISQNALAHAIIRAIDKLYPQGNYAALYLEGRENVEVLFMQAIRLMNIHYVGILLVDEAQNRDYQSRQRSAAIAGQSPLTTLLITATNASNIPILMTGTPELADLSATRMSMVRRTVGRGMKVWKPLSLPQTNALGEIADIGEFDVFLTLLWEFQWTKTPFELDPRMRNLFYYYTQGISDVIIKLFHDVQLRAIRNGGDEIVDEALVHDVATNELSALTELTGAMRDMDYDRSGRAVDLAAYLRIDPHQTTFGRDLERNEDDAQGSGAEAPDGDFQVSAEPVAPPDAFVEPKEVPTGPEVAKTKKPRRKAAPKPAAKVQMPPIQAVDNLDDELGA